MGAGGFIGHHLVKKLISQGNEVVGADIKFPQFEQTNSSLFHKVDLRNLESVELALDGCEQLYQLAADMGGAGYILREKMISTLCIIVVR